MKKILVLPVGLVVMALFVGCAPKEELTDETSWDMPEKAGVYTTAGEVSDASKMQMEAQIAQTKALEEFKSAAQEQEAALKAAAQATVTTATAAVVGSELTAENIQRALTAAGLYNGKIDGVIGPMTEQAIKNFQAQKGLAVDGKVGPKTWEVLKTYLSAASAGIVTSPAVSAGASLGVETGSMVASEFVRPSTEEVQQALLNAGIYGGKVDGLLGPMTESAIKTFQSQNGLTADGKVGPKTWERLKPYLDKAEQ